MNPLNHQIAVLEHLESDKKPAWGIMTPQHMVEHLSATMRISNGKLYLPLHINADKIPARMAFLFSDEPFQRNVRLSEGPPSLRPLHTESLLAARILLKRMIEAFDAHYVTNPDDCPIHPLFGPLNRDQWIRFHQRHMNHHFEQFGLAPFKI
jgi:hypothetical protein